MALTYQLIVLLGLSSGLWMNADADCSSECNTACPVGWSAHNSRCFIYVDEPKTWSEAESACIQRGGNLASIYEDDFDFVRQLAQVNGQNERTWLGAYEAAEGDWKWSNGEHNDFTGWGDGEPNNHAQPESCMEIMQTEGQPFNDAPCDVAKAFICVKHPVESSA